MKILDKNNFRKLLIINILIVTIFTVIYSIINFMQYKTYKKILNNTINNILNEVTIKYPDITEEQILQIVKSSSKSQKSVLSKYGYNDDIANIKQLENAMSKNVNINIVFIFTFGLILNIIYILYLFTQNKKVEKINKYLKEINNKNYSLKIEDNGETELSKLQNELYKTTVLLKESAENSEKEKEQLSNSLADISHQLKTPLTSITIMLDNIMDNPNMDEKTKMEFIREINKQIEWVNSLVISLLKLAKFDAGAIKMKNSKINVAKLVNDVISNLSILLEIKNIEVIANIEENATIIGDYKWQLEAITNILKNSIEHSKENSKIYINVENTSLFLRISIKDEGKGINKEDLKHIFKRFYKSKNSLENSVGIGLALAKAIIEKNNGYIKVNSEENKGTIFEIKYIK
ncbi:MAG: HAMP domain-containing sensor histidine kinase [Clostridia bacterium]|nr:HAMP domain-containing sensor histidine kinase [Clostridia bacterium]